MNYQLYSRVDHSRPLVPLTSLVLPLGISRQDDDLQIPASLYISENGRLISLLDLLYLLLRTLLFQKILLISVLFRSLTADFFPTVYGKNRFRLRTPWLLVGNLSKQICMIKMVVLPTSNKRFLSLSLVKTMIHVCARFHCSAQWNF